jgi:16S rRNA G966 N2-methylase RsmD
MLHQTVNDRGLDRVIALHVPQHPTSFRIIFREERLVAVDANLLLKLERKLVQIQYLSVNRGKPDLEFWFLARRQGFGVFGLRITRHQDYAKILERGELRPELAALMCVLSEPSPDDTLIDPFAGSGAIPLARAGLGRYKRMIASDNDRIKVEKLLKRVNGVNTKIDVYGWDALSLDALDSGSIDKIVTDPPWGLHLGTELDLWQLYADMLREFFRILRPDGLAVILLANKDLFREILEESRDSFALVSQYDILVSGPKAAVYKLRKLPSHIRAPSVVRSS